MKATESGNLKHRQLREEGYLHKVTAEQREYAEACEPSKITETDSTNTNFGTAVYRTVRTVMVCCESCTKDGGKPSGRN